MVSSVLRELSVIERSSIMEVFVKGGSTVYTRKYSHTSLVPMGGVTLIANLCKQRLKHLVSNNILKPFLGNALKRCSQNLTSSPLLLYYRH